MKYWPAYIFCRESVKLDRASFTAGDPLTMTEQGTNNDNNTPATMKMVGGDGWKNKKFKNKNKHGGKHFNHESKECAWLSPCLNDMNNFDEKVVLSSGDNTGIAKRIIERVEAMELVHSWYVQLMRAVDIDLINRLYTDSGRVRCVPKDLTAALGEVRNKLDEIRLRRVPDLLAKHEHYLDLLSRIQTPLVKSLFTNEKNEPLTQDGSLPHDSVLASMLREDKLKYRGMSLQHMLNNSNEPMLRKISNEQQQSKVDVCDPAPVFDTVLYDPQADRFFAVYPCTVEGAVIVGFKLNGVISDIRIETEGITLMNMKVLATGIVSSSLTGGGGGGKTGGIAAKNKQSAKSPKSLKSPRRPSRPSRPSRPRRSNSSVRKSPSAATAPAARTTNNNKNRSGVTTSRSAASSS